MITYIKGNLFDSPAKVLVNTVNTVGVMGKGIAKEFKNQYPEMFRQYKYLCDKKMIDIGLLWIYYGEDKWILNFPTKKHWRNKSKLDYIELGLVKFRATYQEKRIESIAFPRLGCGNGGLDWKVVKPLMEQYLDDLPIDIYIYEDVYPNDDIPEFLDNSTDEWIRLNPQNITFDMMIDDLIKVDKSLSVFKIEDFLREDLEIIYDRLMYSGSFVLDKRHFYSQEFSNQVYGAIVRLPYISRWMVKQPNSNSYQDGIHIAKAETHGK